MKLLKLVAMATNKMAESAPSTVMESFPTVVFPPTAATRTRAWNVSFPGPAGLLPFRPANTSVSSTVVVTVPVCGVLRRVENPTWPGLSADSRTTTT